MAGESQGLGAGSGMVSPDALGLGRAQQQTLAQLAAGSRQQALGEQGQLLGFGSQLLGAGQGISDMERQLLAQGVDAETARAAAAYGAGNLAISPYNAAASAAQKKSSGLMGLLGSGLQAFAMMNPATAAVGGAGAMAGGLSQYGVSDIRLKENIKQVDVLANGLGVYTWDWNDTGKTVDMPIGVGKGVIAQEVLKVLPDAVIEHKNGYLMVDYSHPQLQGIH